MIIDKKQLLMRRREIYDNVVNRITEPQNKDKPNISDVIDRKPVFETNKPKKKNNINQVNITVMKETTRHTNLITHILKNYKNN